MLHGVAKIMIMIIIIITMMKLTMIMKMIKVHYNEYNTL